MKIRGTCPKCGTKLEADTRPSVRVRVTKAMRGQIDRVFAEVDKLFAMFRAP